MASDRHIPIHLTKSKVIDSEFSNIRERFDAEMKKMEDEMTKFRSELMNRESNFFQRTTSSDSVTGSDKGSWLEGINSPLIHEDKGKKILKLRFDVSEYQPQELVVKTIDNKLLVQARHEEKSENKSVYREYNREFLLPQGTKPESIKSSLSVDRILTVEAPLPELCSPDMIPITHQ